MDLNHGLRLADGIHVERALGIVVLLRGIQNRSHRDKGHNSYLLLLKLFFNLINFLDTHSIHETNPIYKW